MNLKHGNWIGGKPTPEYKAWQAAKYRCLSPKSENWKNYGGRGILMCDRWVNSFANFFRDMGKRPDGYSLERKNNNGNYEPTNCVWATTKEQMRNRTNTQILTVDGISKTMCEWSDISGIKRDTIRKRVCEQGWNNKEAVTVPTWPMLMRLI